jgi:hypothetical protein
MKPKNKATGSQGVVELFMELFMVELLSMVSGFMLMSAKNTFRTIHDQLSIHFHSLCQQSKEKKIWKL